MTNCCICNKQLRSSEEILLGPFPFCKPCADEYTEDLVPVETDCNKAREQGWNDAIETVLQFWQNCYEDMSSSYFWARICDMKIKQ